MFLHYYFNSDPLVHSSVTSCHASDTIINTYSLLNILKICCELLKLCCSALKGLLKNTDPLSSQHFVFLIRVVLLSVELLY